MLSQEWDEWSSFDPRWELHTIKSNIQIVPRQTTACYSWETPNHGTIVSRNPPVETVLGAVHTIHVSFPKRIDTNAVWSGQPADREMIRGYLP